uniref:Uncharacterized protein n=1 Tax=Phlebotomus papatasi TaxID=29031 RepID=A0A1B0DGP4_PHLPP
MASWPSWPSWCYSSGYLRECVIVFFGVSVKKSETLIVGRFGDKVDSILSVTVEWEVLENPENSDLYLH